MEGIKILNEPMVVLVTTISNLSNLTLGIFNKNYFKGLIYKNH